MQIFTGRSIHLANQGGAQWLVHKAKPLPANLKKIAVTFMSTSNDSGTLIFLSQRGPNQEPYIAAIFVAVVAVSFIMIGNLNALAPIVTMPFLLTYAAIDYAYFKLAMSYDIRQQLKMAERNKPKSAQSRLISADSQVTFSSYI